MLTAGKQSKTGYWIEPLQKYVYSLEEINYFIYNHIDLVYRDFFDESLFDYLENELDQRDMAQDLRTLFRRDATAEEFVRYILSESYYYNTRELADISSLVAAIDSMSNDERLKIQGDAHMKACNYSSALKCYVEILKHKDSGVESPSFYARIAYSAGSVYARMFMCKSANTFFSMAYDLSPDPVYARACLYMSILADDDEELLSSIVRYKVTDDYLDTIKRRVRATLSEIESSEEAVIFNENLKDTAFADAILSKWKDEYYHMQV